MQSEIRAINADPSLSQEEKSRRIQAVFQRTAQVAQAQVTQARKNASQGLCRHYARNCDIETPCCQSWYACRLCHDEAEGTHQLERTKTQLMRCRLCQTVQAVAEACQKADCAWKATRYYCAQCRLWEDNETKAIYHCNSCGICRLGKREDYWHCDNCGLCNSNKILREAHKCQKDSSKDLCVCGEFMHTSTRNVETLPCGHSLHLECSRKMLMTNINAACPKCRKSIARDRTSERLLQWDINANPMPAEYRRKCKISCNDCGERTVTNFHWLGIRCLKCGTFNTSILSTWVQGERPAEEALEIRQPTFEESQEEGEEEEAEEPFFDEHTGEDEIGYGGAYAEDDLSDDEDDEFEGEDDLDLD